MDACAAERKADDRADDAGAGQHDEGYSRGVRGFAKMIDRQDLRREEKCGDDCQDFTEVRNRRRQHHRLRGAGVRVGLAEDEHADQRDDDSEDGLGA